MTKSGDDAISKRFAHLQRRKPVPLDGVTRAAILEGSEQAERGEFVSDEDMAAFFKRHGI